MASRGIALLACFGVGLLVAQEETPVFRSDVTLVRVDAQVVGGDNRAISGLTAKDFVLRDGGKVQQIRNFSTEEMPIDIVLLLDVSGSMRPHVERIAMAAEDALAVLAEGDRVAIMVFDRSTRIMMPFRSGARAIKAGLDDVLRREDFNGGTEITRSIISAADYLRKNARKEARRAIVILTDDQTGGERNETAVLRSLAEADAVMSAIIAPDAMRQRFPGAQYPPSRIPGGGGWPGGGWPGGGWPGGGWPGRRGPVILGPGGGGNGPVILSAGTKSAGTSAIARESGGDSMNVDDAAAFEDTLSRLRERYALHFLVPEGARAGEERTLDVSLSASARRRHPDAEVRFRRTYIAPGGGSGSTPVETSDSSGVSDPADPDDPDRPQLKRRQPVGVSRPGSQPSDSREERASASSADPDDPDAEPAVEMRKSRRRGPVNEPGGPRPATIDGSWRRADPADQEEAASAPASSRPAVSDPALQKPKPETVSKPEEAGKGGWRKATEADLNPPPAEPDPAKKPKKK